MTDTYLESPASKGEQRTGAMDTPRGYGMSNAEAGQPQVALGDPGRAGLRLLSFSGYPGKCGLVCMCPDNILRQ